MPSDEFWLVDLGRGMGPLTLGTPRSRIIEILREEKIVQAFENKNDPELYVDPIESSLLFDASTNRLKRLDVDDERLRFGPLQVHGKRVDEIVQLLDIPKSETLWCDFYEDNEQAKPEAFQHKTTSDADLIKHGTLWIISLGLGLSLYDGRIVTVHLCDPEHSPRFGSGQFTKEQRRISEVSPVHVAPPPTPIPAKRSLISSLLLIAVIVAMGLVAWQAIQLQKKWNNAPEVAAKIVSIQPPPPEPFPEEYTLFYLDTDGGQHEVVFRANDLYGRPEIGEEVMIRFLPEAPDKPLSLSRYRDVGFDYAIPYGIAIFASYWILNLGIALWSVFRKSP